MMIHKCDICKKQVKHNNLYIRHSGTWDSYELCLKCADPIFDFLKKNKLVDKETHNKALDKK